MIPEEWARCWKLFGPWVVGEQERARVVANMALNGPGLDLMRRFDALDQLGRIQCPTLACAGELDVPTPVSVHREIVDGLPPGLGQLAVIPGAGHFMWKDAPDRFWPVLTDFVETVGRGRG